MPPRFPFGWIAPSGALLAAALLCAGLSAEEPGAGGPRAWRAERLATAPVVDGDVRSDPAWRGVAPMTGFSQLFPDNGEAATRRTEVYLGFTDAALHVGVVCHDDPEAITISNDGFQSDSFAIVLDPYRGGLEGMVFGTNPVGAEYDGQVADGRPDWAWSTVWEVEARIHADGWSAELAIPFTSLRYRAGEAAQTWGVNAARVIIANNEVAYWSPIPRQFSMYRLDLAGAVAGFRVPAHHRNLKVTPYALVSTTRPDGAPEARDEEFGFDVKYSITQGLTLDLTYNTDFAQVESDQLQVNLGRFSLFFPETRPFFLENAAGFQVGESGSTEIFHSRRIGIGADGRRLPIEGGARVSGHVGAGTHLGFLQMRVADPEHGGDTDFTVARVNQHFKNRTSLGFMATNRAGAERSRQSYAVDGQLGIGENTLLRGMVAATRTPGETADEHALSLSAAHDSGTWSYDTGYSEVGAGFDPAVGFVSRRGYRRATAFVQRTHKVEDYLGINEWRPFVSYRSYWDFDGYQETAQLHLESWVVWRNGADLWTAVNFNREGVKQAFPIVGCTVAAGEYDTRVFQVGATTPPGATWSGGMIVEAGGFYSGDSLGVSPYLNYRRDESLSAWAGLNHRAIELPGEGCDFDVNIVRAGFAYSFTPKISVGTVVQYSDASDVLAVNFRFSLLQSANAGLYFVYNEVDDRTGLPGRSQREVALKYSRIFDVL